VRDDVEGPEGGDDARDGRSRGNADVPGPDQIRANGESGQDDGGDGVGQGGGKRADQNAGGGLCGDCPQECLTSGADDTIRWQSGERLEHLFQARCDHDGAATAVVTADETWTFGELDARANRLAHYLRERGLGAADRIGLLLETGPQAYVALLAALKAGAAFVPLDPSFPTDRISYIAADAGLSAIVTQSHTVNKLDGNSRSDVGAPLICVDAVAAEIASQSADRPIPLQNDGDDNPLCYVIYTSGTTGRPKGVAVHHASICNFVRVAAQAYGIRPSDRVYQGMSIAFDFSVEELWVPLIAGAALVPATAGSTLVGDDLAGFLKDNRVSVLCCVPTLLATIEADLPDLRLLLVSGEACPQALVTRWHRSGRVLLNAYGPTEATVTATVTELHPDKPVTIGAPLPTYTIAILHECEPRALPRGALGEIAIAGVGLASGYLNRPDLTDEKFIDDVWNVPNNPSGKLYRTGDLGCINASGQVEYHGRIDTQIKIRGYRIELAEIETVLLDVPEIAQAAASAIETSAGHSELAAYYTLVSARADIDRGAVALHLREKLPSYMVPAFLERLDRLPMSSSHKIDRKALPAPASARLFGAHRATRAAPQTATERMLCRVLGATLKAEITSVDDHLFHDLGAHSLLMARFCASLRDVADLPDLSIRDTYLNPSVRRLAELLDERSDARLALARGQPSKGEPGVGDAAIAATRASARGYHAPSNLAYVACGAMQGIAIAGYSTAVLWLAVSGIVWAYETATGSAGLLVRLCGVSLAMLTLMTAVPVAVKWAVIGRWRCEAIPIWSARYFRFWLVRTLTQTAPPVAMPGTPIYNVYLRLLGAKVGPDAVLEPFTLPVATDLLEIGARCVIRRDVLLNGYKAQGNVIYTGAVRLGDDTFVGDASTLDINTTLENGAELAHASCLHEGRVAEAGCAYHGSPAVETTTRFNRVPPQSCSSLRRWIYCAGQILTTFVLPIPLVVVILSGVFSPVGYAPSPPAMATITAFDVLATAFLVSAISFFGGAALLLAWSGLVARFAHKLVEPSKTYPLFGVRYFLARFVARNTWSRFFNNLFGDTSAIVGYLTFLGVDLGKVVQTGSNFGAHQRFDHPGLCHVGGGTMASDGLYFLNMETGSSGFRVSPVAIGRQNYLGNVLYVPGASRAGDNCLIATKTMIPVDGPLRENVGLLGSPAFEIPRMVAQDREFRMVMDDATQKQRLREKNRHNLVSAVMFIVSHWLMGTIAMAGALFAMRLYPQYGVLPLALTMLAVTVLSIVYYAGWEKLSLGLRRLTPRNGPLLDRAFWSHERYWKVGDSIVTGLFPGTPFKTLILRLFGVQLGAKVFDDGCRITERTLVKIGDGVNLNAGSTIQSHSLEEGHFKSDWVVLDDGATLGVHAFVHYGTHAAPRAIIEADAFVMKGERLAPGAIWCGNPAHVIAVQQANVIDAAESDDAPHDGERDSEAYGFAAVA